jgi:hypothetical protein
MAVCDQKRQLAGVLDRFDCVEFERYALSSVSFLRERRRAPTQARKTRPRCKFHDLSNRLWRGIKRRRR